MLSTTCFRSTNKQILKTKKTITTNYAAWLILLPTILNSIPTVTDIATEFAKRHSFIFEGNVPCTFWTKSRCSAGCATPRQSVLFLILTTDFPTCPFQMRWLHFWKLPHPVDPVLVGLRTREVGTPFSNYLQVKRKNKFFLNDEHSRCALQGFDSLVVLLFSFSEVVIAIHLCCVVHWTSNLYNNM